MDVLFLRYVCIIKKHESYLADLRSEVCFRRDRIVLEKNSIEIFIDELQKIMEWIHNYGILVNVNARRWSAKFHRLIKIFEKKLNKFANRIDKFDDDNVASDSYDEEFGNATSSSD